MPGRLLTCLKVWTVITAGAILCGKIWAQVPLPSVSPPPQAAGFRLVYDDEFDKLDLSPDGSGEHAWYAGVWFHRKRFPLSNISVRDSQLSLVWQSGQECSDTSIETASHDGLHGKTWRYGYFEMRAKWDVVKGAWPALWLIPVQDAAGQALYAGVRNTGELDIFEGSGAAPHTYFGTLHEWIDKQDISTKDNHFPLHDGQDLSDFHTYGALWVPGKVTWYLDSKELHSEKTPAIFDKQDFFLVIGMNEGVDWRYGDRTGVVSDRLKLTLDWVRVWQK
jgi:hypothetical protein